VTAMDAIVNRNKRNLQGRGKEGTAAAVAHLEETHTAQRTPYTAHRTDELCGGVNLLVCCVVSAGKQLPTFRSSVPVPAHVPVPVPTSYIPHETSVTVYQPHSRFNINLGASQNTF